jgi:hypothetical protein
MTRAWGLVGSQTREDDSRLEGIHTPGLQGLPRYQPLVIQLPYVSLAKSLADITSAQASSLKYTPTDYSHLLDIPANQPVGAINPLECVSETYWLLRRRGIRPKKYKTF